MSTDCSDRTEHAGFDRAAQLHPVREGLDPSAVAAVTSRCLDACESSTLVAVVTGASGRDAGAVPAWLGGVPDDHTTAHVLTWVAARGPDQVPEPVLVDLRTFRPSAWTVTSRRRRPD